VELGFDFISSNFTNFEEILPYLLHIFFLSVI